MFYDPTPKVFETIAKNSHLAIFATPVPPFKNVKPYYILSPDDHGKIPLEAVRALLAACTLKQPHDTYVFINHAETLSEAVQNALLKLLEEPNEHYHFLIFTEEPPLLLPTILSRAKLFYPRPNSGEKPLETPLAASESDKTLARALLTAQPADLPQIADKLAKNREKAVKILNLAIEIAEKSYFKTKNRAFLRKLPKLLRCQENLKNNGHVKLHIVADLC